MVGTTHTSNLDVLIRPKMDVDRLFYLLGFTTSSPFVEECVAIAEQHGLGEAMVAAYCVALGAPLRRGLLNGYVRREEAGMQIRGRMRHGDQMARRLGRAFPVEVEYDDFTADTPLNRTLNTALIRCERLRLHSGSLRKRVRQLRGRFEGVERFSIGYVPALAPLNRLDARFGSALTLARIILSGSSTEFADGASRSPSFLIDMDYLFETFLYEALGRRLRRHGISRRQWRRGEVLPLDTLNRLRSRPDLSAWKHRACAFVGDAKHKRTEQGELPDIYQLMAYCSATSLPSGMLIYAAGAEREVVHQIVDGGPRVIVASVDLEAPVSRLELRLDELAVQVLDMWQGGARVVA